MNNMANDNYVQRAGDRQSRIQSFAFVISVCGCALLSIGFGASSLLAVRQSSISRAEAIVAYRGNFSKEDSNSRAFRDCDDLQKIRGIGPKTAQNISEWLKFE